MWLKNDLHFSYITKIEKEKPCLEHSKSEKFLCPEAELFSGQRNFDGY